MSTTLTPREDALPLLRALRRGPAGKTELARLTGWSRNTVSVHLSRLLESGWAIESGEAQRARGRPSSMYRLDPGAALVFVTSFGWDHLSASICTLSGEVLATRRERFALLQSRLDDAVNVAAATLKALLIAAPRASGRIAYGVVGVPIPTVTSPILDWPEAPLIAAHFSDRLGITFIIENDANLMAMGSYRENAGCHSLLFLKIATGIGGGVVIGGRLHRGNDGLAGEIGHIPVERAKGMPCSCGNYGCVTQVASVPAILKQVSEASPVRHLEDVAEVVAAGNPNAVMTLRQAGRDIGEALLGVITGIAPERIVIGGRAATIGDHLAAGIRETLSLRALPALSSRIQLITAANHEHLALWGAAEAASDALFGE